MNNNDNDDIPLLPKLKIKSAPKIRQVYWCDFGEEIIPPEMTKNRPVVILSYKHTLHGHCLVVPISTDPQEGKSAKWAHKLGFDIGTGKQSWVVCNHLYTVSTRRLSPIGGGAPAQLPQAEFDQILTKVLIWLPNPDFKPS